MNIMTKYTSLLIMFSALFYMQTGTVIANDKMHDCKKMTEQVTFNVRFNGVSDSASAVQIKVKAMEKKIIAIGKELGIKGMKATAQNFNLNSMQGGQGNGYNYSGGSTFQVKPFASAVKLADRLKGQGYYVNLSVNRYQRGGCSHSR